MLKERREPVPVGHSRSPDTHISAEGVSGGVRQGSPLRRLGDLKICSNTTYPGDPGEETAASQNGLCTDTENANSDFGVSPYCALLFSPLSVYMPLFCSLVLFFLLAQSRSFVHDDVQVPRSGTDPYHVCLGVCPFAYLKCSMAHFLLSLVFDQMSPHPQDSPDCPT